ncbi:hypothetical protein CcaverHIS002_0705570 [Cutaneotrichosporon cavernicola]|uniref:Ricin B lectin domain-containing protein n=1 Tax=Cutaneotrichosporon cavernicola TaxID=279322 RepID=A0AA48QZ60_9TREE|nr:uncharacterized protein CcaverHIS019_0705610 [Cutaneotrichosporon cavernicola]BEI87211.1 hypothetical protein CcaverHIS002_0705570 [Cutaneotrichosporon cavernicola]BEI94980.1 hypothetical protein CcaverHIS019_0705610 [Cutaneotrichosporon cavernicola]BEJ02754.1 hypothetical protein CcaverHIS631_0705490 [Cutaneotrichosporon cavernicola]
MLTLPLAITCLASLVAATADEGRLLTRAEMKRILWRYGADRKTLVTCGGGPYVGARNGDKLTLATEYLRYCNPTWGVFGDHITSVGSPERCIDATLSPGNGVQPHMWECYNVPQQKWRYHSDGTVRLDGRNLCLDVTDGDATKKVQMWTCSAGNRNQQWDLA